MLRPCSPAGSAEMGRVNPANEKPSTLYRADTHTPSRKVGSRDTMSTATASQARTKARVARIIQPTDPAMDSAGGRTAAVAGRCR